MNVMKRASDAWQHRWVKVAVAIIALLVIIRIFSGDSAATLEEQGADTLVSVTTPAQYSGSTSLSLIGTARAFTEAQITSERSGRVVSVGADLGDVVVAGQIVATLENASERAAVLQAQGQYESALAAAAQSGVGVDEAQNALRQARTDALAAYTGAYNTVNGVVLNSIDDFFADPQGALPGLRLNGRSQTAALNADRVSFRTMLSDWQNQTNIINETSDLPTALATAKTNTRSVIAMVDTFITLFNDQDNGGRYTTAELQTFSTNFTTIRSSLIGVVSDLDSRATGLQAATEAVKRAEIAASGGVTSAADAQVKTALGSLRSAQANLAETILRSPIAGTVNEINVRTGDFINSFSAVAVVANNDALEIVTYISDAERAFLQPGDEVLIEGEQIGTVTNISPAVDSQTKKIEVRIATEGKDIFNGDTVRITKQVDDAVADNQVVQIPLTAVKFELEDGFIFKVSDGVLESVPVTLGQIVGGSVQVLTGLDHSDTFVVDVRGLVAGQAVEVIE